MPWTADALIAGAARFDLFRAAGFAAMPDTFEELERAVAAVHNHEDVAGFVAENIYGWTLIPFVQGFGGNVFRSPPEDLFPTLDTPEFVQAAEFLARLLRSYGPAQAVGFNFDAVTNAIRLGRVNYAPHNHAYLMQLGEAGVRTRGTVSFGLVPAGPRGRFPSLSSHGWGIPAGARHKDAAWEFIRWSLSKELLARMVREKGYGSVTRTSIAGSDMLRERMTINGVDTTRIFGETLATAAQGHMAYRTVHVYPQVNTQINQAMERVVAGQMGARESFQQAQRNAIADLRRAGVRF